VDILGNTIESSSIYLFPFIIEYSMIGSTSANRNGTLENQAL